MDSVAIVEAFIREGLVGRNRSAVDQTVASPSVVGVTDLLQTAFADLALITLGPIFANADGSMVACFGQMHLRQVARFLHVDAVGREADVEFNGIYEITDGKISRMWVQLDFSAL